MSWDLFLKSLEDLNSNLTTPSKTKKEVYKILVEHNKNAELDFLMRLTKRKLIKKFQELNLSTKSTSFEEYGSILNTASESFNLNFSSEYKKEHIKINNAFYENFKYHTLESSTNVKFNGSILQGAAAAALTASGIASNKVVINGAVLGIALSLSRKNKKEKVVVPVQTDTATSFFLNFSI